MRDDTRNWIASAEYELDTARDMLEVGRYVYVIITCNLALEKMLKAHVGEVTQSEPPRTHSLMLLVRRAGLEPPSEVLQFLGKIANGSVPTRYPDDFSQLLASCSREVA